MKYILPYKLFEVHYLDKFPDEFQNFKKKYTKILRTTRGYNLYVQFSNFKDNQLDKTAFSKPTHGDPKGNYAYHLKYVMENPSDIWYGYNANYLRVLEKTDKCNTLDLQDMDERECRNNALKLSNDWDYDDVDRMIDIIKKTYKERMGAKNKGYWGRIFFQMLQMNVYDGELNNEDDYPSRTNQEQTNMLLKAGWDAIEDYSHKDKTAVINYREPQQICFLNMKGFKVIDVFKLSKNQKKKDIETTFNPKVFSRKWSSKILEILDDKIKEADEQYLPYKYYSVKGRQIIIKFEKPQSYYDNRTPGQKIHKEYKLYDDYCAIVRIETEKGLIKYTSKYDELLLEICRNIEREWNNIKDNATIENWIPITKDLIKKKEDEEQQEKWKKEAEDEKIKDMNYLPEWKEKLEFWKNYFNSPLLIPNDKEDLYKLYKVYKDYESVGIAKRVKIEDMEKDINILRNGKFDWKDNFVYAVVDTGDDFDMKLLANFLELMKNVIIKIGNKGYFYDNFYNFKEDEVSA